MTSERDSSVAFYSLCDSRYFLGAVALLNSLRRVGHEQPLFLLDCGLEAAERELLAPHAVLVPGVPARSPVFLKSVAPLTHPADVMVLLDADLLVVRNLAPLLERASEGQVVAFADRLADRFFPEWGELLDLGPIRRHTYVNVGLLVLPGPIGRELLELVTSNEGVVDLARTGRAAPGTGRPTPDYPFRFLDQDVWNAVLVAERHAGSLVALEHRLAPFPPFRGLRVVDGDGLECRYADGTQPFLLHHVGRLKPWLATTRTTIYWRLMSRVLLAPDARLRLEPDRLPLQLRPGARGWLARRRGDVAELARLPRGRLGVRKRLAARRRG